MGFREKNVDYLSLAKAKYKRWCKNCGLYAAVFLPIEHKTKKVCRSCGKYIFVSDEEEFKERLKEKLWRRK